MPPQSAPPFLRITAVGRIVDARRARRAREAGNAAAEARSDAGIDPRHTHPRLARRTRAGVRAVGTRRAGRGIWTQSWSDAHCGGGGEATGTHTARADARRVGGAAGARIECCTCIPAGTSWRRYRGAAVVRDADSRTVERAARGITRVGRVGDAGGARLAPVAPAAHRGAAGREVNVACPVLTKRPRAGRRAVGADATRGAQLWAIRIRLALPAIRRPDRCRDNRRRRCAGSHVSFGSSTHSSPGGHGLSGDAAALRRRFVGNAGGFASSPAASGAQVGSSTQWKPAAHLIAAQPDGGGGSAHGLKSTRHCPPSHREIGQLTVPSAQTLHGTPSCGHSASDVHWPCGLGPTRAGTVRRTAGAHAVRVRVRRADEAIGTGPVSATRRQRLSEHAGAGAGGVIGRLAVRGRVRDAAVSLRALRAGLPATCQRCRHLLRADSWRPDTRHPWRGLRCRCRWNRRKRRREARRLHSPEC